MSSSPPTAAPFEPGAQPAQTGLSEPARIVNTFFSPSKTFLDIRQNASWWAPLLLISIVAITFWITVDKKVGFDQIAQQMIANSKQMSSQPPEQQARIATSIAAFTKWSGYFGPIFIFATALISALVLWGTFNFATGAEINFSQSLAVVMYGWLPKVVGGILGIVTVALGNPEGFRLESPIGTNPAYFMDPSTTSKFVLSALSSLDIISLWLVALLGIGFALISKKKLSFGPAIGIVAGWYFLVSLVGAVFAGLRG